MNSLFQVALYLSTLLASGMSLVVEDVPNASIVPDGKCMGGDECVTELISDSFLGNVRVGYERTLGR